MKNIRIEFSPLASTLIAGLLGALLGAMLGGSPEFMPSFAESVTVLPNAYRVPKVPGGTALRLAMVHDILHERYLRHGTAWYQQRNLQAEKTLAAQQNTKSPSEKYLDAMDDLAVGLERTGQPDRAIALMRQKVELLSPIPKAPIRPTSMPTEYDAEREDLNKILATNLTPLQKQQYSACANLGTILLLANLDKAMGGDRSAQANIREALDWIERSIAINPNGHFGREIWQAIAMEDLLTAMKHPDLLEKFDVIGDSFDAPNDTESEFRFGYRHDSLPEDSKMTSNERLDIRRNIPRVGLSDDWAAIVHPDYPQPMPFDEPTLAIIGMWTMGGGPNPHFALALGRIMEQIGQPSIAWEAYERAIELQDSFWPDTAVRKKMVNYCLSRQNDINEPDSLMRQRHRDELAWGIAYQQAYTDYEAKQIAAGVKLDDPDFYKGFFTGRPSIASDPGLADDLLIKHLVNSGQTFICMIVGMGLAMAWSLVWPKKKEKSQTMGSAP